MIAVGSDGTVHEVANSLLRSERTDATLAIVPLGSANDYAWSLRREFGADGHSHVRLGRCRRARLRSETPLCAHADGELLCTPEDDVHRLDIELLPGRLGVQLWRVD